MFWMDHGVSGFSVRDASYLYEDYDLRDEPNISTEVRYIVNKALIYEGPSIILRTNLISEKHVNQHTFNIHSFSK